MAAAAAAVPNRWVYAPRQVPIFFWETEIQNYMGEVYQRPDGTWSPTHIHFVVKEPNIEVIIRNLIFNRNANIGITLKPEAVTGERIEYGLLMEYPFAAGREMNQATVVERIQQLKNDARAADLEANFGDDEEEEENEEGEAVAPPNRYAAVPQNRRARYVPADAQDPVSLLNGSDLAEGTNMVNFHDELAKYKRFYTQNVFNRLQTDRNGYKENPATRQRILPGNVRRYKSTAKRGRFANICKNGVCAVQGGRRRNRPKTRKSMKRK